MKVRFCGASKKRHAGTKIEQKLCYILVYPFDLDIDNQKISIQILSFRVTGSTN